MEPPEWARGRIRSESDEMSGAGNERPCRSQRYVIQRWEQFNPFQLQRQMYGKIKQILNDVNKYIIE